MSTNKRKRVTKDVTPNNSDLDTSSDDESYKTDDNLSDKDKDEDEDEDVYVFTKEGHTYVEKNNKKQKKDKLKPNERIIYDNMIKEYEDRNVTEIDIINSSLSIKEQTNAYELLRMIENEFESYGETENWFLLRYKLYIKVKNNTNNLNNTEQKILDNLEKNMSTTSNILQNIIKSEHTDKAKSAMYKKYCEIKDLPSDDPTVATNITWINKALSLPTRLADVKNKFSTCNDLLNSVYNKMNDCMYGQTRVKEKILETVTSMWVNEESVGKSMVFIGPPGVGKTAFARSLAHGLSLPFYQISFGGIKDSSVLTGHMSTYIGSKPGELAEALISMGVKNGILFLDEIDKLTDGGRGIEDTLLHILDYSQNHEFKDHYFTGEIPLDLSKLIIIASVNSVENINKVLLNRLHLINFNEYTHDEKIHMSKKYIIPEILKSLNLNQDQVIIDESNISYLINKSLVKESGVRNLIRNIKNIYERINTLIQIHIKSKNSSKKIKLSYDMPNFKLPVVLNKATIDHLFIE